MMVIGEISADVSNIINHASVPGVQMRLSLHAGLLTEVLQPCWSSALKMI